MDHDMDHLLPAFSNQDREPLPFDIMGPDRAAAGRTGIPPRVMNALKSPETLPEEFRKEGRQGELFHARTPGMGSSPLFDKEWMLGCIPTITIRFSTDNHQFIGPKRCPYITIPIHHLMSEVRQWT
jgi:hypothetical protein